MKKCNIYHGHVVAMCLSFHLEIGPNELKIEVDGCDNFLEIVEGVTRQLGVSYEEYYLKPNEPRREKTGFLHMRKQRRRSASR